MCCLIVLNVLINIGLDFDLDIDIDLDLSPSPIGGITMTVGGGCGGGNRSYGCQGNKNGPYSWRRCDLGSVV